MRKNGRIIVVHVISLFVFFHPLWADVSVLQYGSFKINHELTLPGSPETIYDAITGDISGWWDHSFSEDPLRFFIDAKPGGGFYEIFDRAGNGVLHATVIAADRGKLLRFDGPLGLSGRAVKIVHTYQFSPVGSDSTLLKFSANISGEIDEKLAKTVDHVWSHFLFERFKPFVEEGKHLLFPFEENQRWGYKNKAGKVLIKVNYQIANAFNRFGIASIVDDVGWGYIDSSGKILLRPYVIDNGPDYFEEGLARYVADGKIGFMNELGASVIPAIFDFVTPFSEGLAAFCIDCKRVSEGEYHRHEAGKWGYINKTGEIVVAPEFDSAGPFQDGKATVTQGEQKIILNKQDIIE
jgi:hypothetical protein